MHNKLVLKFQVIPIMHFKFLVKMLIEEPLQASVLLFILGPDKYKQTQC